MPILAEETSLFPDTLLENTDELFGNAALGHCERNWWVVYTKARQEKALARELLIYGIPFYLPLVPKDNVIRGRRVRSRLPLFTGYVFLYADESERGHSLTTNRISYTLRVKDHERLQRDLQQINRLIIADAPLTVERRLMPGQRVRIKNGPFLGIEGTLISRRGRTKLLLSISFLGQGASVEIDDFLLEPI